VRSYRPVIHPHRYPKLLTAVVALVCAVAAVAASPAAAGSAKSKTPCWKTLINDWYDGRIDGVYPIPCYREALKHLPADVDAYSSARDDIKQALQRRIQSSKGGGASSGGGTTTTTTPGNDGSGGGSNPGGGAGSGGNSDGNGTGGGSSSGPLPDIINAGKPAHADSVPIPLLVLGGLALILMAAGAAGYVVRRQRQKRELAASAASFPSGTPPRPSEQP
jgi:hypothetical protein